MQQNFLTLFTVIGLIFGFLAGLMAFLIAYNEYRRHFTHGKAPLLHSIRTAVFTFAVMFVLTLAVGYVLVNYVFAGNS